MIPRGLSLDQAPPLSVPLRFFVTAPLFGVTAAALLVVRPEALASRWTPTLLAAAHLFLLGFVVQVMLGAMLQVLPVVAGAPARAPRLLGAVVHVAWSLGTVALAGGLLTGRRDLFAGAVALLGAGAVAFLAAAAGLVTTGAATDTVRALRLACAAFAVTVGLGILLASGHAGWATLHRFPWTDVHLAWGLVGWVSVLVLGVSYQVVPMLFTTPAYPRRLARWSAPALVGVLAGWSLAPAGSLAARLLVVAGAVLLATHAVTTLVLLGRRRRHVPDATVALLRLGCGALALACTLHVGCVLLGWSDGGRLALAVVLLHSVGFASATVVGMLLKIVPFLVWFHLQGLAGQRLAQGSAPLAVPTMKEVVSDRRGWTLALTHGAATALACASPWMPDAAARLAHAALGGSFALLLASLVAATRTYVRVLRS